MNHFLSHKKLFTLFLISTTLSTFLTLFCSASNTLFLLQSQDKNRLNFYQKAGLQTDILVEDITITLGEKKQMLSAGSWILSSGEKEISPELLTTLKSETMEIPNIGLTTVSISSSDDDTDEPKTITFEDVQNHRLPNFNGTQSLPAAWLTQSLYDCSNEEYLQWRSWTPWNTKTICVLDARSGKVLGPLTAEREWKALKQFAAFEKMESFPLNIANMNSTHTAQWINRDNDLYYVTLDGQTARRLTNTPEAEELVSFSPDGNFIAYVSNNNLWVADVIHGSTRALTKDGSDTILNGKCSWVYFEEVYDRNWKAYWWSPNSRQIIFYRSDESPVTIFTIIDETENDQRVISTRYPRAGESNPRVTLAVASVTGGTPQFQNLHEYDPENYIITRAGFTAENKPWFIIQDRAQKWADYWIAGVKRFRDSTPTWIEPSLGPLFLKDGSLLATSTRDGFRHLYYYGKDANAAPIQLTQGSWEIRDLISVDEPTQWVYFTATRDNLIAENLYRVHIGTKTIERLTWEPGTHRVSLSPNNKLFADAWSNRQSPGNTTLRITDGASLLRTLHSNPVPEIQKYRWGKSEQFAITLQDGYQMEVAWILPPDFDPTQKYPVWMSIYGGPEMPTIRDNWAGGRTSDQSLAAEGVIIFYADPRVASGKGAKYAWPCYRHVYVSEGNDLAEAITWLGNQSFVDKDRIGLSGYSYGGSMTLWMLSTTKLFCAGIAGGSVTYERDYDTIYTERYMDTPQNNPEGYAISHITPKAPNLHGRLLIVHGQLDDNVHPANTWKFVYALQKAGIQYEQMVYPRTAHAYGGPHHYQLMRDFIRRQMKLNTK